MYLAPKPNYRPHPVTATVSIDNSDNISGKMKAKCTFPDNAIDPGNLWYEVTWLFDNLFGYTTGTVTYNDILKTDIILDHSNIKYLGRMVNSILSLFLTESLAYWICYLIQFNH